MQTHSERFSMLHGDKRQKKVDNYSEGSSRTYCSLRWAATAAGSSSDHTTAPCMVATDAAHALHSSCTITSSV
jgi:hypothetical protein